MDSSPYDATLQGVDIRLMPTPRRVEVTTCENHGAPNCQSCQTPIPSLYDIQRDGAAITPEEFKRRKGRS